MRNRTLGNPYEGKSTDFYRNADVISKGAVELLSIILVHKGSGNKKISIYNGQNILSAGLCDI